MALKMLVEKIDDVEEANRPLYVEKDGKFRLDVDGYEDIAPLKAQLTRVNRENASRRVAVERFEKLGKTADELEEILAQFDEMREKIEAGHKPEDLDLIRKQAAETATKEAAKAIKKAQDEATTAAQERDAIRTQYERSATNTAVLAAITEHKGNLKLLEHRVLHYVRPKQEDGRLRLRVVDDNGEERFNSKGEPMTPSELVAEMAQQDEFAGAFAGSGNSGGGTKPAASGSGSKTHRLGVRTKRDLAGDKDRSFNQKFADFIKAYPSEQEGLDAYNALPE